MRVRCGQAGNHRQPGIVERLFGAQCAQELLFAARGSSERPVEWVHRLPEVVGAINDEPMRLLDKKPAEAIKAAKVAQKPSLPARRVIGMDEPVLGHDVLVRFLYAPGELEGGSKCATDPNWSLTIHAISTVVRRAGRPALYHLVEGSAQGFVREGLLLVPIRTEPPDRILNRR